MALADPCQEGPAAGRWGPCSGEIRARPASADASAASLPAPSGSYRSSLPGDGSTQPEAERRRDKET